MPFDMFSPHSPLPAATDPKRESGFTLLEVLISMAVLVFISFAIYQATIETFKLRDTLTAESDFINEIYFSVAILQRDISMLYSPHIVLPEKKQDPNAPPNQQQQQQAQPLPDDLGQTFPYWSPALDPNGVRPSHFIGSSSKISFVSLSHLRIYKDSPESEFAKISYDLKKDDKNPDVPDSMILVKTESANAFGKDETRDEMIQTYELLHGIKTLEYTFYQRDGNTWKKTKSWDNEKEENKNTYPDMIELKISVKGKKKQAFEGNFKMRPEIPLRAINPSY